MEERVVWSGTSSQILNFGIFFSMGMLFVCLTFLFFFFWQTVTSTPLILAPALACLAVPFAIAFYKWLVVKTVRFEVTSERIRVTSGILSKKTNAVELYRAKDYTLEEPFFYRLFKLGNIHILTSDPTTPQVLIEAVSNAKALVDEIRQCVEARRDVKRVRAVDFDQLEDVPPQ